ncbi:MAG: Asp-tRNA(Asn)/Glu-tRNA(Gln) amidotransferase subunit GatB [Candidatus Latescibacteria bacterium]|nr:Asp-tRNA(Asn)/Glu-tRNA(Gln) amidotransferase subunit GatB [Candidatus Latescibacterota bacterium]
MTTPPYEPVIGLEIHAQLRTKSKLFCACSTEAASVRDVPPNTHICPICTGHPGVLPRPLNRRAVVLAVRLANACHCTVHPVSDFDRKNYFYADLPKGYQITQNHRPLATDGWVEIEVNGTSKRVRLHRVHLEEDPGKSKREGGVWLVDMNRCGVPLVEVVTAPDLSSAAEAAAFTRELRRIGRYLDVCDGNMEMGNLRCDANVSIRPAGTDQFGTKTEIKNLNSFRFLEEAIAWEIERQQDELRAGRAVEQITILWDEHAGVGRLMREKESAADYRYFREPNLINVHVDAQVEADALAHLPELPLARQRRYVEEYDLSQSDAAQLAEERPLADYFETTVAAFRGSPKRVAHWVRNQVMNILNDEDNEFNDVNTLPMTPAYLAELLNLVESKTLSETLAPQVFQKVLETGLSPQAAVQREGLALTGEDETLQIVERVLRSDPDSVQQCRSGNEKALNRLIGQAMRLSKGRADAKRVRQLLQEQVNVQP